MAEQVDGHDVGAVSGQMTREVLVHPTRHQLPVDEHDPAVAAAVLRVLQPVAVVEELPDPLRNQGHGAHLGTPIGVVRGPVRAVTTANVRAEVPGLRQNRGVERDTAGSARLLLVACLVLITYISGAAALIVGRETGATAAWFPAAGVGVLTILVAPRSRWPGTLGALTIAFALANFTVGRSWEVSLLLGLADSVEVALVGWLVMRFLGGRLRDVNDVWRLFAIAAVGAAHGRGPDRGDLRLASRPQLLEHASDSSSPRTRPRCCWWRRWGC